MKKVRRQSIFWRALLLSLVVSFDPELAAQTLTPVSPAPEDGTFWSLQRGDDVPALPFIPPFLSSAPVYSLGNGYYVYDDLDFDYAALTVLMSLESVPPPPDPGGDEGGETEGPFTNSLLVTNLWLEITPAGSNGNDIVLTITNVPSSQFYDLFRTFELVGSHLTNSVWRWIGRGTNGQSFSFPGVRCGQGFYVVGFDADSDSDGLTDAFELLVSKSSPATNHTFSVELDDREWWLRSNVLVNDPQQDCGNEQNSQFESTCVVLGTNVIIAWVDSNQGVYGLGSASSLSSYTPRLVGYSVSQDGGVTFQDKGVPPLARGGVPTDDDGDAGDPVLAVDSASEILYLAGTSPRNAGNHGIPLWKSTDGGVTFADPLIVLDGITSSDKPWISVDNFVGTGQHDVYLTCSKTAAPFQLWLTVATNSTLSNWIEVLIRESNRLVQSPIPVIGPDHVVYTFWFEGDGVLPGTNWLKMRKVENRGATLGDIQTIRQLVTTNVTYGNLELLRSNTSTNDDTFRAFPFPVPAANPAKTNHLYLAYADRGTNSGDKADVFFLCSTNGGANWTEPVQASTQWTNDQWMPVLAVKPDGTQLFLAWYDRRNDTNNSLIDLYGRFASLAANGEVNFSTNDFRITATNFAPVFAGTLTSNTNNGHYDPVYPPWQVNLHWWYPEWPAPPGNLTAPNARDHVGEYNGAWGDGQYVFLTWTDYRIPAADTLYARNQSDIRLVRIPWAVIRPLRMKTRKKTISTVGNGGLIALLAISTAFGQSGYWLNNYFNQGVNAPVFDAQGIPLAGTNYLAELWGGAMPDSLTPAVAFYSRQRVIVPFLIGLDAGYFVDSYANRSSADHPTVLSVPPYVAMAWLEVRAWDARLGSTYEQVVSLGLGGYGESPLFSATGTSPADLLILPAPLTGLQSFNLRPVVPEPGAVGLLFLGGLLLLWRKRFGR